MMAMSSKRPSSLLLLSGCLALINASIPMFGQGVSAAVGPVDPLAVRGSHPTVAYSTYLDVSPTSSVGTFTAGPIAVDSQGNSYVAQNDYAGAVITKLNAAGTAVIYVVHINTMGVFGLAVDMQGNAYVGGIGTAGFPATPGAYRSTVGSNSQGAVIKLNPKGQVVYATLLGGSLGSAVYALAVDRQGNAYVGGSTGSPDFPTTPGAFETTFPNTVLNVNGVLDETAFVAKVNATGTAVFYSTFLGASTDITAMAVDEFGDAYVAGASGPDLPVTAGSFQKSNGLPGGFVTKFDQTGSALVYSTFLGGSSLALALDKAGNAYVGGDGNCSSFPTTPKSYEPVVPKERCYYGIENAYYVAKLNAMGSGLLFSTFFPDQITGIAVDDVGSVYVGGSTTAADFPVTPDAFQTMPGKPFNYYSIAYLSKLNRTGSTLLYSTFLSGDYNDLTQAIAVDRWGGVYVTGLTASTNFPLTAHAYQKTNIAASIQAYSGFVTKFQFALDRRRDLLGY